MRVECVELRFIDFVMLPDFSIKALQCLEEQSLVGIIKCLAEVQVLQFGAATGTRCQAGNQQQPGD